MFTSQVIGQIVRILIISPILSLAFFSGVAFGAEQELKLAYQNSLGDIGLKWDSTAATSTNTIVYGNEKIAQPKSEVVALAYAILPGYFIPAAFGHAYAEANVQAAVISSARLSGRIMWMYSFFDNFFVDNSEGSISGGAMAMFYLGLAMDLGGYLYDILHAPIEVAQYNRRFVSQNAKPQRIEAFIDIKKGGPWCGVALHF